MSRELCDVYIDGLLVDDEATLLGVEHQESPSHGAAREAGLKRCTNTRAACLLHVERYTNEVGECLHLAPCSGTLARVVALEPEVVVDAVNVQPVRPLVDCEVHSEEDCFAAQNLRNS